MANLKQVLLTIRSGGLRHSLDILRYTFYKQRLDEDYARARKNQAPLSPGKILEIQPRNSGCIIRFENATLEVGFLASDLLRVSWEPGVTPIPYALFQTHWPPVDVILSATGETHSLSTSDLKLEIQADGGIGFFDSHGTVLRRDMAPQRSGDSWSQTTDTMPGELFCGLGIQAGPFNLLDRAHALWGSDPGGNYAPGHDPLYMPIPVYFALNDQGSYLIFYENASKGEFRSVPTAPSSRQAKISFESGRLQYYFTPGPPERAMRRFTELTGRAPLPPIWSLGYHQSRWGYKSEADLRFVIEGFHQHDLPISAIHLDIDYMHVGRAFTFDPGHFPDVQKLCRDLNADGIRLVTIVDPGVIIDPEYDLYQTGLQNKVFCTIPDGNPVAGMLWLGRCHYPDFTNPTAREWWGAYYQRLCTAGVRGFWHDMNEPTSFVASGDLTLPLSTQHNLEGQGGDHVQGHNLYGMQMNRSAWEALRYQEPDSRPWILSRSGWVGGQRYAWNWTADTDSTWESLRMNLISILGLAMSGFPYTGPDIGGFSGDPSAELYLRWFQMASFLPFFRTHSAVGTARREPWVFGEPYTTIIRRFLKLRYSLLPYFYTLAWSQTKNGAPLVRPLFWHEWQNPLMRAIDDCFFLGDAMLVAPIFEKNAAQRKIVFPEGRWYNFWENGFMQMLSGQSFTIRTKLEDIPVFIRAGSILPFQDGDNLTLNVYPNGDECPLELLDNQPAGSLYCDAGDGYGPWRVDRYYMQESGHKIRISRISDGVFSFPYSQIKIQLVGCNITNANVDGLDVQTIDSAILLRGNFNHIDIETENNDRR